jgi:hypothetical protein
MLDFNKMMEEINKDISESEQGKSPVSLEEQQKKLDESINNLNKFTENVSEEFSKKFQEMHEMFFEQNSVETNDTVDNNLDTNGEDVI